MFGKDLVKDVKSETSSNFKEVMVSLCNSRANFLARICRNAIRVRELYSAPRDIKFIKEFYCLNEARRFFLAFKSYSTLSYDK